MNKTEKPINIITSSIFNVAFSLGITSLFEITNNIPTMIAIGILTEIMTLIAYKEEIKTLIKNRKTDIYLETIPLTLYFIGGFIFHLFWETKSQYAYPYVVFIIPVAAYGLYEFRSFIDQKFQKR